jgi:hypothetical protein
MRWAAYGIGEMRQTSWPMVAAFATAFAATSLLSNEASASDRAGGANEAAPLTLIVDLSGQRVNGYRGTERVWSSRISSGKRGHRTPTGVFSIIQKRRRHFSNLYNNAPMPHMQRLTWSGIAFHGGPIPGYPASHGCVRLPYGEARNLFRKTNMKSTRVVVTYGAPRPTAISHALLPDRLPPTHEPASEPVGVSNEGSETDGFATRETTELMNSVIGVSTALASYETPGLSAGVGKRPLPPARSRAEVESRLAASIARSRRAMTKSAADVVAARDGLATTTRRLRTLNVSMLRAQRDLRTRTRRHAVAERSHTRLVERMTRLMRANVDVVEPSGLVPIGPELERLAEQEDDFDTRLADLRADRELLAGEIADLKAVIAALKPAVRAAQEKRYAAKAAYTEAKRIAGVARKTLELSEDLQELQGLPVHVLISREKSKIYVRQGYKDIYNAPVTFATADAPVGTHVFTAIQEADDRETLRWSAVTVPDRKYKPTKGNSFRAKSALDRVTLSEEVRQRLRELVKVGSSIIVSDRGPSIETGKGTDFIVLTR